MKAYLRKWD